MTLGAFINLAIDPILIFGWFGVPRLELAGAAAALVFSRILTAVVLMFFVYRDGLISANFSLAGFRHSAARILHIGLPAMATQLIVPISATVITRLLAGHGEIVIAGYGIASRIEGLAVIALYALSGSIGPFIGQNWAAGKQRRALHGLKVAYRFSLLWGLGAALVLAMFGATFVSLIDTDPVVTASATFYLAVVPWSYGLWGILMMASASFNGLGSPLPSTVLSFSRMFLINIPMALLMNHYFGYRGIFVATAVTNVLLGAAGFLWFRHRYYCSVLNKIVI